MEIRTSTRTSVLLFGYALASITGVAAGYALAGPALYAFIAVTIAVLAGIGSSIALYAFFNGLQAILLLRHSGGTIEVTSSDDGLPDLQRFLSHVQQAQARFFEQQARLN